MFTLHGRLCNHGIGHAEKLVIWTYAWLSCSYTADKLPAVVKRTIKGDCICLRRILHFPWIIIRLSLINPRMDASCWLNLIKLQTLRSKMERLQLESISLYAHLSLIIVVALLLKFQFINMFLFHPLGFFRFFSSNCIVYLMISVKYNRFEKCHLHLTPVCSMQGSIPRQPNRKSCCCCI